MQRQDCSEINERAETTLKANSSLADEPRFNHTEGSLCKGYYEDWLSQLVHRNTIRIRNTFSEVFDFLSIESVQYIFTVCVRLRLPQDVRFVAALIFDRFMCIQTKSLWDFIVNSKMSPRKKEQEWEKIEANLSRQIPLRIITAIQIASKAENYHSSLSIKQVCSCLRSLGQAYTKSAVLNSEMRVLKTIGYEIPESPLVYPESLLKCLCYPVFSKHSSMAPFLFKSKKFSVDLDFDICWHHTVLFLDIVFLHHDMLYSHLVQTLTNSKSRNSNHTSLKHELSQLKMDWMLLGCGLVSASISCVHGDKVRDEVVSALTTLCKVKKEDILDICVSLKEATVTLNQQKSDQKYPRTIIL